MMVWVKFITVLDNFTQIKWIGWIYLQPCPFQFANLCNFSLKILSFSELLQFLDLAIAH